MEEIEKLSDEKACEALKIAITNLLDELKLNTCNVKKEILNLNKENLFEYWKLLYNMSITRESIRITDDLLKICKEV